MLYIFRISNFNLFKNEKSLNTLLKNFLYLFNNNEKKYFKINF